MSTNHLFLFMFHGAAQLFQNWLYIKSSGWIRMHMLCVCSLCIVCTSVLVSLLSQITTPAVPMAALSPMALTRSAWGNREKIYSVLSYERSARWLHSQLCSVYTNCLLHH